MGRRILIVGGVAGGASAAARLRRLSEEDTIIIFERGPHVSYSNCSLPYHLSGIVPEAEDLVLMSPDRFRRQYNIEARINNEVISIDAANKTIRVKDLISGDIYTEGYDKLILSPGASPIVPRLPGIEKANIFTIRNVVDIDRLKRFIELYGYKDIAVIGGGYVGVEAAENLSLAGGNVTIIEATEQILRPFDYDMVQIFHKVLYDNKVNLIVKDRVESFDTDKVILSSGREIKADVVVMAIGVAPETGLAREAGLDIGETGAIRVNEFYQTSNPDIYAIGDAIEVYNSLTGLKMKLPLAGPALKQARAAADHINGRDVDNRGFIGSSAIKVFDHNGAATGLNEAMIKALDLKIDYETVCLIQNDKVSLMPDAHPMHFKLLFEVPSGRILGAQAIGRGDVTKRVDVIATVIKLNGTVADLKDLELCYAPPFSTAKDIVNYAGYIGSNLLNSDFRQVGVDKVRRLVEEGSHIIDIRERREYVRGHVKGAVNIPLSELRQNASLIPKDKPVYLYCRSGQRSYNAVKALVNMGYDNVINIAGSFLDLSYYEYFNDVTTGRDKIVTDYNFR
jgi:NADPH-dependent 2,4-dienoyl-CoA reductase/sulfur reductase-like enzyme/rhodanese-related sulfurtransferase